jgi:chromosome partitioning protein
MVCAIAAQKGGVGKTTTAINIAVLLARQGKRVLVIDTDPQSALSRQLGLETRSVDVNLVDVLAGVEMSLVGELGRERFLVDALEPVLGVYDEVVIDTPPNLGLLTVNALVCADRVIAPVSAEDEASVHGIFELRVTIAKLAERLGAPAPELIVVLTRWHPHRISSRAIEYELVASGLTPRARIRLRSAAVTHAAAARIPVALSAPDSSVALGYQQLVEQLGEVTV